jgi:hypothetical protein
VSNQPLVLEFRAEVLDRLGCESCLACHSGVERVGLLVAFVVEDVEEEVARCAGPGRGRAFRPEELVDILCGVTEVVCVGDRFFEPVDVAELDAEVSGCAGARAVAGDYLPMDDLFVLVVAGERDDGPGDVSPRG